MRNMLLSLALLGACAVPAMAEDAITGDVALGEKVWKKCRACHVFDTEKNKIGPSLLGIVGRAAGSVEGYKYSKALQEKAGEIGEWDAAKLDGWLEDPSKFLGKRSKMTLKLKKAEDRANVIAFLAEKAKKAE